MAEFYGFEEFGANEHALKIGAGDRQAGVGMGAVVRALIPQMMISVSILLVITYVPAVGMALVHAFR